MARLVISRCAIAAAVISECTDMKTCRRTELPIYIPETEDSKKIIQTTSDGQLSKTIEKYVGTVRKTASTVVNEISKYEQQGVQYVTDGVDQAQWLVKYLGEENNPAPKGPAIAIGGLTGFILAVRGGVFRKIIFTTAGALGMAGICFPREASEYSQMAIQESRQYATIAYNFVYGVKKDDPPLELPSLPKMPTSVSEAWSLVSSVGKSKEPPVLENEEVGVVVTDGALIAGVLTTHDPQKVIADAHEDASNKQCHCPVGACLNPHEEEESAHPSVLPYPPPLYANESLCPPCPEM